MATRSNAGHLAMVYNGVTDLFLTFDTQNLRIKELIVDRVKKVRGKIDGGHFDAEKVPSHNHT